MKYSGKSIVILGAGGGIGSALVHQLATTGAHLILIGRNREPLDLLKRALLSEASDITILTGDLVSAAPKLALQALSVLGKIDIVINCAGMQTFGFSQDEAFAETAKLFATNVVGPIQFINTVLPHMLERNTGQIVNVGSIFGSIAFPCFASYSASKFALRGFSEALRRELTGTGVSVNYVAPRYTRTSFNRDQVARMADQMKMNQDEPDEVAWQVIRAMEANRSNTYLGWPEKLFVRLNALFPWLVDQSLGKQVEQMRPFTKPDASPQPH